MTDRRSAPDAIREPIVLTRGRVLTFLLATPALYVLLAIAWPTIGPMYASAYQATATSLFGRFGEGRVTVGPPAPGERFDSSVSVGRPPSKVIGTRGHSSRLIGYLPTVLTGALIICTPLPWRRRVRALVWGLALVHAFIAIRIVIGLLQFFSLDAPWRVVEPGPFGRTMIDASYQTLALAPTASFLAPVAIWAMVCLRPWDIAEICAALRSPARV